VACAIILATSCGDPKPDDGSGTTPVPDGGADTGSTWTESAKACDAANVDGYFDAWDQISDCECVEEEVYASWGLGDYSTDLERECYIGGWGGAWQQWCTEMCFKDAATVKCCAAMFTWAVDQFPD